MQIVKEKAGGMDLTVAYMSGTRELSAVTERSQFAAAYHKRVGDDTKWAGGTEAQYHDKSRNGDVSFARRAEKYVDDYANLAIKDYERILDYNLISGQLDYQAAMGGDPMCMYGQSIVETDTAPVHIYIDMWTSSTVPAKAMEMRGIAVLALTLSLSAYRPVMTKIVTGLQYTPTHTNSIQVITVPTTPMDLSVASWMLGSPMMFRRGIMPMACHLGNSTRHCGLPRLSNSGWQSKEMGKWLAEKEGVRDVLFLPQMFGAGEWLSHDFIKQWMHNQMKRFLA